MVCALWLVTGCQQPKMDMAEMMKPPPRPTELDQLDPLVGRWEGTAEMRIAGMDKPMTFHGTSTTAWEADRWALVERSEGTMEEGGKYAGLGTWSWDSKARVFRQTWIDNHGGSGSGTATYDASTKTWHMKARSSGPRGSTVGEGTVKLSDSNTMEWNWTEWDSLKLRKMMEMHGTSKRVGAGAAR
jgi:hypothetical protein